MKSCSNKSCKQLNPQPLDSFHKRKDGKNGLASRCKSCKSETSKKQYQDPTFKEYNAKRPHGKYYKLHKKDSCERCGFIPEDLCQLDVDHIDGHKSNSDPSNLQTLCANCHRLKTKKNQDTRWT